MTERDKGALARWENEGGTVPKPPPPQASTLGSIALAAAALQPGAALRFNDDEGGRETSCAEWGADVVEVALGLIAIDAAQDEDRNELTSERGFGSGHGSEDPN